MERAALDLMDALKAEIEENDPLADQANLYEDLLSAALREVNYHEIAKSLLEDNVTEEPEEEEPEEEE